MSKIITCTANRGRVYRCHFYMLNGNWIPCKVEVIIAPGSSRRLWEKTEPVAEMTPTVACAIRAAQRRL